MRRITWFSSPHKKNIKTRVGQEFLKLIDNNFPVGSILHKVLNRNDKSQLQLHAQYETIIKQYNARICGMEQENGNQPRYCNCRKPKQCPLSRQCLTRLCNMYFLLKRSRSFCAKSKNEFKEAGCQLDR